VEMLVVIAIISVLTTVTIVSISGATPQARDAERVTDLAQIQLMLEEYYNSCRQYPSTLAVTANNGCPTGVSLATFLDPVPQDPVGSGVNYDYEALSSNMAYLLRARLEQNHHVLASDLTNAQRPAGASLDCDREPHTDDRHDYCVKP